MLLFSLCAPHDLLNDRLIRHFRLRIERHWFGRVYLFTNRFGNLAFLFFSHGLPQIFELIPHISVEVRQFAKRHSGCGFLRQ